jgi:uncharacterized protein (UPF0297 family)
MSMPLNDGKLKVIYLNEQQKERLAQIFNKFYVRRNFFNSHGLFNSFNCVTIFSRIENPIHDNNENIAIYLSLNERGFKYITGSGFINFILRGTYLNIQNTDELRAFVKDIIRNEINDDWGYEYKLLVED